MAVAFTQEFADANGATSTAVLSGAAVTVGRLVIAQISWDNTVARTLNTVADNAAGGTNTWTKIGATLSGTLLGTAWKTEVWWAKAKATETLTVTGTFSGAVNFWEIYGTEFSGQDTTAPIDASHSATGTGSAPSHAVTTIADNCMVYGIAIVSGAITTPGSYTNRSTFDSNDLSTRTAVKTPAGVETVTWGNSVDWLSWLVSIAPPAAAPTGIPRLLMSPYLAA